MGKSSEEPAIEGLVSVVPARRAPPRRRVSWKIPGLQALFKNLVVFFLLGWRESLTNGFPCGAKFLPHFRFYKRSQDLRALLALMHDFQNLFLLLRRKFDFICKKLDEL